MSTGWDSIDENQSIPMFFFGAQEGQVLLTRLFGGLWGHKRQKTPGEKKTSEASSKDPTSRPAAPQKSMSRIQLLPDKGFGIASLIVFIAWMWPPPSNSHHQDYETFLVGDPYKPSFATVTGGGHIQIIADQPKPLKKCQLKPHPQLLGGGFVVGPVDSLSLSTDIVDWSGCWTKGAPPEF